MRSYLVVAAAVIGLSSPVNGQGTLSAQGFGYPPGQLSTHAASLGGSLGEFDPLSPINPSSLAFWSRGGLYFQYEPEFRHVQSAGQSDRTTTSRFPLTAAAVRLGARATLGIATSTFLDRTWSTEFRSGQILGSDSVLYTERFRSEGAINDVRLGLSWAVSNKLAVGIAGHAFPGENRLSIRRQFDDTAAFGTLEQTLQLGYSGTGFSAGLQWRPTHALGIAASGRIGGSVSVRQVDSLVASATIPNRYGGGIRYELPGVTLSGSAERILWSQLQGLGTDRVEQLDAWDYGAGADMSGPKLIGSATNVRLGYRHRTLPFAANSAQVTENTLSGGMGLPLAGGRVALDLALQRAARSASGGTKESAVIFSLGLSIHP
jgi:hypothetical protein